MLYNLLDTHVLSLCQTHNVKPRGQIPLSIISAGKQQQFSKEKGETGDGDPAPAPRCPGFGGLSRARTAWEGRAGDGGFSGAVAEGRRS